MRIARPLALQLRGSNVDPQPILAAVGLSARNLFAADERVPLGVMNELWDRAAAASHDPLIGARTALMLDFSMFEHEQSSEYSVLQLMATSATIGDAFARLARFGPLGFGPAGFSLRIGPTETAIVLECAEPLAASLAEFIVMTHVRSLHLLPAAPIVPLAVRFAHHAPELADIDQRYVKLVGVAPQFAAADHAIVIKTASLEDRIPTSRPALVTALERRANEELRRTAPGHSLVDRARSVLVRELERGNPSAERVAEELGMSVRSVARKLAEAGTSHKALLDEIRSQAARRLLLEAELTVEEVSRILGFADASAFHRAFKRWYGSSPAEFRVANRTE